MKRLKTWIASKMKWIHWMNAKEAILKQGRQLSAINCQQKKASSQIESCPEKNTCLDKGIKLFVLYKDHSPADLRIWKCELEDYFNSGNFSISSDISLEEHQQRKAHFSKCISEDLLKAVEAKAKPDDAIFGEYGYFRILDNIFQTFYPIFFRRVQLFKMRQKGEDHLSYME